MLPLPLFVQHCDSSKVKEPIWDKCQDHKIKNTWNCNNFLNWFKSKQGVIAEYLWINVMMITTRNLKGQKH